MVYLYAVLGVVMMTGIMAIVEMGLSLTGQSFILKPPLSSDRKDSMNQLKKLDRSMLSILYQEHEVEGLDPLGSPANLPLKGSGLCDQILCRVKRQSFCLGEEPAVDEEPPFPVESLMGINQAGNSSSDEWSDSCALEMDRRYRFLIRSDSQDGKEFPYSLYSCVLKDDGVGSDLGDCDFESFPEG